MRKKKHKQTIFWTVTRTFYDVCGEKVVDVEIFSDFAFASARVVDLKTLYLLSEIEGPLVSFMMK